jgi:general secretion pathway protein H
MTSRSNLAATAGFTLIEMLVVIAIMGLVLAMVTSFRQPRSQWLQNQTAARQISEALRDAHGQAIAEGHPVAPLLPHLPATMAVSVQAPPGGIVFAPDGSASGGRILLGNGASEIVVSVDWLTGRVATHAP